jgi:hypothetical protein
MSYIQMVTVVCLKVTKQESIGQDISGPLFMNPFVVGVPHVLFFLPSYSSSLNLGLDAATLLAVVSVFDLLVM